MTSTTAQAANQALRAQTTKQINSGKRFSASALKYLGLSDLEVKALTEQVIYFTTDRAFRSQ